VIVHPRRQANAAASAAASQHFASIGGSHARPETMHAQAAANLWLISSLRHLRNPYFFEFTLLLPECSTAFLMPPDYTLP
jgi:hypothetical protein